MVTNNEVIRQMCLFMQELWLLVSEVTLNICLGTQKEPSHRDNSLSTRNMCFGWQIKKVLSYLI